jgi:radical SAM enzyme (TIGR01210 family)
MNRRPEPSLGSEILSRRDAKNAVDPRRPYAFFVEPEAAPHGPPGTVEEVATIFLTNRECPFRCLMCDLWKNTTDETVPLGAIPEQMDWALARLPAAAHVKLYNSGNFFDPRAIPPSDHAAIARRVAAFRSVIVENHPALCGPECLRFRDRLEGRLEVALGLETAHPEVLARLNKRMTVDDFRRAAGYLASHDIRIRAFILLPPPFLDGRQRIDWTHRSVEVAFAAGAECCALVPLRDGNGMMEELGRRGEFISPSLEEIEEVLEAGLAMGKGRVLADLWDVERIPTCSECGPARRKRLREMNLAQRIFPPIACDCTPGRARSRR